MELSFKEKMAVLLQTIAFASKTFIRLMMFQRKTHLHPRKA